MFHIACPPLHVLWSWLQALHHQRTALVFVLCFSKALWYAPRLELCELILAYLFVCTLEATFLVSCLVLWNQTDWPDPLSWFGRDSGQRKKWVHWFHRLAISTIGLVFQTMERLSLPRSWDWVNPTKLLCVYFFYSFRTVESAVIFFCPAWSDSVYEETFILRLRPSAHKPCTELLESLLWIYTFMYVE